MTTTLREKRPSPGWALVSASNLRRSEPGIQQVSKWTRDNILVISELANAELPSGSGTGWQWLVSCSSGGERPTQQQVRKVLRAFRMEAAEEDNHHPGVARHFWLVVDEKLRVECECKTTEVVVTEKDGYRWSNSRKACRGCELQLLTGRRCPLHAGPDADLTRGAPHEPKP